MDTLGSGTVMSNGAIFEPGVIHDADGAGGKPAADKY